MGANSVIEALRIFPIPLAAAFSFVALVGYVIGLFNRNRNDERPGTRRELKRARSVVGQLETLNVDLRRQLESHRIATSTFKQRLAGLASLSDTAICQELSFAAEVMLKPTHNLATTLANAYDEVRQQASFLMMFTEVRTDPLTGLANRRALDETIASLMAMWTRYQAKFSIAMFDVDFFKQINDNHGHLQGDRILAEVAQLIERSVRDTDVATRYGGEEFVVVMPETDLAGASIFADRIRQKIECELSCTVSGGVTQAMAGDEANSMFDRADEALYAAKEAGRNRVFCSDGESIELVVDEAPPATSTATAEQAPAELVN